LQINFYPYNCASEIEGEAMVESEMAKLENSSSSIELIDALESIRINHEKIAKTTGNTKASEESDLIAAAYSKAIDLINRKPSRFADLEKIVTRLIFERDYWKNHSMELSQSVSEKKLQEYRQEAENLASKGLHNEAIAKLLQVLDSESPEKDNISAKIAMLYFNIKDFKKAIEYMNKAIDLNPSNSVYWYNKGVILYNMSDYQSAAKCYETAIELNPKDREAWTYLGSSYSNLSRFDKALKSYQAALDLEPQNPDNWYNKGKGLYDLERYSDAVECFDRSLLIKSDDAQAWGSKGNALYQSSTNEGKNLNIDRKIYEQILECYDNALKIDPKNIDIWYNKGVVVTDLAQYDKSVQYYMKALEINPEYVPAKENLAEAFFLNGQFQESIELASQIYKTTSDPIKGFIMRLLITSSYFLGKRVQNVKKEAQDLLEYAKSLIHCEKPVWSFDGMKNVIDKATIGTAEKELLLSFILFIKTESAEARRSMLDDINKKLSRLERRIIPRLVPERETSLEELQSRYKISKILDSDEDQKGWYIWTISIKVENDNHLLNIDNVKYIFPSFFSKPEWIVEKDKGNKNFAIKVRAYGEFRIRADVKLNDGKIITKYDWLSPHGTNFLSR
jgi:tetratricopeptide (TPR) repeat protein